MKQFFLILLSCPFLGMAQDSTRINCKLIKETDPFTKEKTISTGFIEMQGGSLTIDANKQEIDILFTVSGVDKCFSDQSVAAIFFEGTKLKQSQRSTGAMNCEGIFQITARNGNVAPVFLRRLATQKVEKIIFTGNNKKETTVTLTPEQRQLLQNAAACIMKEAPTLLQQ